MMKKYRHTFRDKIPIDRTVSQNFKQIYSYALFAAWVAVYEECISNKVIHELADLFCFSPYYPLFLYLPSLLFST